MGLFTPSEDKRRIRVIGEVIKVSSISKGIGAKYILKKRKGKKKIVNIEFPRVEWGAHKNSNS